MGSNAKVRLCKKASLLVLASEANTVVRILRSYLLSLKKVASSSAVLRTMERSDVRVDVMLPAAVSLTMAWASERRRERRHVEMEWCGVASISRWCSVLEPKEGCEDMASRRSKLAFVQERRCVLKKRVLKWCKVCWLSVEQVSRMLQKDGRSRYVVINSIISVGSR